MSGCRSIGLAFKCPLREQGKSCVLLVGQLVLLCNCGTKGRLDPGPLVSSGLFNHHWKMVLFTLWPQWTNKHGLSE